MAVPLAKLKIESEIKVAIFIPQENLRLSKLIHVFLHIMEGPILDWKCVENVVGPQNIQAVYAPTWNQSTGHQVMVVVVAEKLLNLEILGRLMRKLNVL